MAQKQKLSIEEKVKIIQAYLSGEISKSEAVRRGGVIWNTMNQWMVDERLCVHAEQLIQQVLVIYMKSTPERGKPRIAGKELSEYTLPVYARQISAEHYHDTLAEYAYQIIKENLS